MTEHKILDENEAFKGSHSSGKLLREILGLVYNEWGKQHRGPLQQYAQGNKEQQQATFSLS